MLVPFTEKTDSKALFRNQNGFPPTVCVQLLKWCNLKCINCRAGSSPYEKEQLHAQHVIALVKDLASYGRWRISITGGEPFYWKGLDALLNEINFLELPFSVTTNGFSSTLQLKRLSGQFQNNATLYVSLDGNEFVHDALRGKGSYNKAIAFLRFARKLVPRLYVNTVLFTDPNLWVRELYSTLNSIGVDNWTIISPVNAGRWMQSENWNLDIYNERYNCIHDHATSSPGKMKLSFLDFAGSANKVEDVVFVNSDGRIRLPGFYEACPKVENISIEDSNAANKIYYSVKNFIQAAHYMR
jgi:MoaA/NifB/PqqE/SkfB family radical SAM enzyme